MYNSYLDMSMHTLLLVAQWMRMPTSAGTSNARALYPWGPGPTARGPLAVTRTSKTGEGGR